MQYKKYTPGNILGNSMLVVTEIYTNQIRKSNCLVGKKIYLFSMKSICTPDDVIQIVLVGVMLVKLNVKWDVV